MHDASPQPGSLGPAMHALLRDLMPLMRGIGGEGNRQTLRRLGELIPIELHEVASGTAVFDWTVPEQWDFRDAYVKDATGRRVIDAQALNLHVVSHSRPIHATMSLDELRPQLHTRPDRPDDVPYRHTFYADGWGFCLSQHQLEAIKRDATGPYEVCIDAGLGPGSLVYGECVIPGDGDEGAGEVVFSAHSCHPALANDNLSGMVVQAYLAYRLLQAESPRRLTYRFLFAPSTIGALAWLHDNRDRLDRIVGGMTLANLGDAEPLSYRRSRARNTDIDRVAQTILPAHHIGGFDPTGGDERQFGAPGFDLPIGALMRSGPGGYPEYHTSGDNVGFVTPDALAGSLDACFEICRGLEAADPTPSRSPRDRTLSPTRNYPINTVAFGEPQLGRRSVLEAIRSQEDPAALHRAVIWALSLADGRHDPTAIAQRSGLPQTDIDQALELLQRHGLIATTQSTAAPLAELQGAQL